MAYVRGENEHVCVQCPYSMFLHAASKLQKSVRGVPWIAKAMGCLVYCVPGHIAVVIFGSGGVHCVHSKLFFKRLVISLSLVLVHLRGKISQ